jgi:hypothetical protein
LAIEEPNCGKVQFLGPLFLIFVLSVDHTELILTDGSAGTTGPVVADLADWWTLSKDYQRQHNVLIQGVPNGGTIRGFSVRMGQRWHRVSVVVPRHEAEATRIPVSILLHHYQCSGGHRWVY